MRATLDKVVGSHKVVLFMKGTKDFPQCGFSHTVVQILRSLDVPFETLDVLANEALRQGLKDYSSWPTFPQLYIDGEFFGGCDITVVSGVNFALPNLTRGKSAKVYKSAIQKANFQSKQVMLENSLVSNSLPNVPHQATQ
ncbi:hypothetical protein PR202_gb10232 [Eleusine coracana subsp. coracana]|uniref:Glutaredoxin domain-containing protein n=1 Tax=Eleusine coracana subsp. coracana TaxID=191504 RepID=A0AAV5EHI9_ELECO|nr:hypothetical protein PR202_gb10232 [Eleusine coracana subsp. coracana]